MEQAWISNIDYTRDQGHWEPQSDQYNIESVVLMSIVVCIYIYIYIYIYI